jgi:hypothetical protein
MPVSSTVTQFRTDVIAKGGPQISSKYMVRLFHQDLGLIECYPQSVIIPGRLFSFYDQDIWGPTRKIPLKRAYTQCNMTFIVYQDWAERKYLENWMNRIIVNSGSPKLNSGAANSIASSSNENENPSGSLTVLTADEITEFNASTTSAIVTGNFNDSIDYDAGRGYVSITPISSNSDTPRTIFQLFEAYPASISPLTMASDGTGYPSFTVGFQFKEYRMS